jgi:ATP-binding cassette subfamily F protein 3
MLRVALVSELTASGNGELLDATVVDYVSEVAADILDDEYCPDDEAAESMNGILFAMLEDNGFTGSPEDALSVCEAVVRAVRHPEEASAADASLSPSSLPPSGSAAAPPPAPAGADASAAAAPAAAAAAAAAAPARAAAARSSAGSSPSGGRAAMVANSLPISVWTGLLEEDQRDYAESLCAGLWEEAEQERRQSASGAEDEEATLVLAEQLCDAIVTLLADTPGCSIEADDVTARHPLVREAKRRAPAVTPKDLATQLGAVGSVGARRNTALLAACTRRLAKDGEARATSPDPTNGVGAVRLLSAPMQMGGEALQATDDLYMKSSSSGYAKVGPGGEVKFVYAVTAKDQELDARLGEQLDRKKTKAEKKRLRDRKRRIAAGLDPDAEEEEERVPCMVTVENVASEGTSASSGCIMLLLEGLCMGYGGADAVLLDDATLRIVSGRRYGLIGRNGVGKSTLLDAVVDLAPKSINVLHVAQEAEGTATTVLHSVLEADLELVALRAEEAAFMVEDDTDTAGATVKAAPGDDEDGDGSEEEGEEEDGGIDAKLERMKYVYQRLEEIDADGAVSRAATILAGLGFPTDIQEAPTSSLSGGWRMRLALARALFGRPDLLLLDEPSNHLDLHAVLWLETYLCSWPATLIVVAHEKTFLNNVCTDMINMERHLMFPYRGNYDLFEQTWKQQRLDHVRRYAKAMDDVDHMQAFVNKWLHNKFGYNAGLVQSRIKLIERFKTPGTKEHVSKPPPLLSDVRMKFDNPGKLSNPMVQIKEVSFRYGARAADGTILEDSTASSQGMHGARDIFREMSMKVNMGQRIGIVGPNGAGKSTLLKLLTGAIYPTEGAVVMRGKCRCAHFSQHFVEQIDLDLTPLDVMRQLLGPEPPVQELRRRLGGFGIGHAHAELKVKLLSGGQKARVAFAQLCSKDPHLLVLDEPTNHLDIATVGALGQALIAFKGAAVIVSHDERLLKVACNELWSCDGLGNVEQLFCTCVFVHATSPPFSFSLPPLTPLASLSMHSFDEYKAQLISEMASGK